MPIEIKRWDSDRNLLETSISSLVAETKIEIFSVGKLSISVFRNCVYYLPKDVYVCNASTLIPVTGSISKRDSTEIDYTIIPEGSEYYFMLQDSALEPSDLSRPSRPLILVNNSKSI